jgi:NAD-dependent dihydropyrimidine dehydrogenase PreA subunit
MKSKPHRGVRINKRQCLGCGLCILACPVGCLEFDDEFNDLGYQPIRYVGDGCRADGLCSQACPAPGVISVEEASP